MQKIVVTGGCGYIGSHTLVDLIDHGFEVISIDNLSNSAEEVLDGVAEITGIKVKNYAVDLCDLEQTRAIFRENHPIAGVIHFAALKSVGDSVAEPLHYFQNNLSSLLNVLQCMQETQVQNLIFSSSCSVYGNATELPVTESTPFMEAESPYARTKQIGEQIIKDVVNNTIHLQAIALRYFNPAGAHPSIIIGESARNLANNLVPVITETAIGKRKSMTVFGTDYPTKDGSCVRDFIHVCDIAHAHTLAMQKLLDGQLSDSFEVFNLGTGSGVSVLEAIQAFESESGVSLHYELGERRAGDVVSIYANNEKASAELQWKPVYDIRAIMQSAWEWEKKRSL